MVGVEVLVGEDHVVLLHRVQSDEERIQLDVGFGIKLDLRHRMLEIWSVSNQWDNHLDSLMLHGVS